MPEAARAASAAKAGSGHVRHRRAREIPFRDIGRKVVLFAAANALVSLLLPWAKTPYDSANAFGLGMSSLRILGVARIAWVAKAVWFVPLGAAVAAGVAFVDRRRSTGMLLPYVSFAAGGWMVLLAGNVFETCPFLRQIGVIACGIGGLVFIGGGAILLKARWRPAPVAAEPATSALRRLPWASVALVIAFTAVHALLSLDAARAGAATLDYGLIAGSLKVHALVTYVFLHGDWLHLAANAAVLLAVGSALERRVGRATFVAVFMVAGVAGGVASAALDPRIHAALVGSSGGVAGCVGLCLVAAPRARVSVWIHVGVAAAKLRLQAAWLFSAWMLYQAVGSVYLSAGDSGSTAYWAHIGGMVAGITAGAALRRLGRVAPADEPPEGASTDEGTNRGLRRVTRRERAGLRYMPHALVSVAALVSAVAAALTFHPASLDRAVASFQRAWNSGDLDRVARFFPEPEREDFRTRLGALVRRFDPDAGEGRTGWRIALSSARREEDETTAAFVLSPPGEDPFRVRGPDEGEKRLRVLFRREHGAWVAGAVGANVRSAAPADLGAPPPMPVPFSIRPRNP
ncbi:MAG: rhomboid family intramembrane serine protease [Planctomycetota bacterium]|jgi:membrane associated rhomboid family serine protease